jgi:CheY-like chemotaxis protein
MLMWTLERHGFRTILAACGLEAVQLAIKFQPSLGLMDICMPGMDDYRATQAMHAHPRGRNIPVAAVSADCGDEGHVSRAFKGVFIACLGKPWEEEPLLQMVTKVLASDVKTHATSASERSRPH